MSIEVTPQDFPQIRWRGHWIWVPEEPITPGGFLSAGIDPQAKEAHGLFRKTVQLDTVPERAPARITADSRYLLYVNGAEVFRGPIRSQPRRLHYDLFDIAPYLRPGENTIAIYVKYFGKTKSFWMPAVPNMTLGQRGVLVFEARLGDEWLVSDGTWKARKSNAWTDSSGDGPRDPVTSGLSIEIFDARKFEYGWQEGDYDDSLWDPAQVVPAVHIGGFARTQPPSDPYGPLYPRPIAKLGGDRVAPARIKSETLGGQVDAFNPLESPVVRLAAAHDLPVKARESSKRLPLTANVPHGGMARITLDMGRIVAGTVGFTVKAAAGTTFDLSYSEEPVKGHLSMDVPRSATRYVARGENDSFHVFDVYGLRYANILAHGVAGEVALEDFWVQEEVYPWQEGAYFSCDDDTLNAIYMAGVRTVQLNSHDAFLDCPTREQRAWVGDSVVHQMVHLATNPDWRLAWHYLTLGNSPRSDGMLPMSVSGDIEFDGGFTIPDWALHWVHGVHNLYRFTGDKDAVKRLMPTVEMVLRWYAPYQTADGVLKDVVEWNLVDWSSVFVEDTSSILTSLWARGLKEFAEMAAWLEEKSSQRWAEGLYERARAGFEMFWDEARGSYIDHIKNGEPQKPLSQLAGALAICSGLAPAERWERIVGTITDAEKLVVRSWTGGVGEYSQEKIAKQFMGIYEADWDVESQIVIAEPFMSYTVHDAVALAGRAEILPDLYPRWAEFLDDGYDTIGECWGWGTHVHGWSCSPTRDMIFYTLGVTPAEPGYSKARIAPRLGRLRQASGSVPTPHGLISVEVSAEGITVYSPVPFVLELAGKAPTDHEAGKHQL